MIFNDKPVINSLENNIKILQKTVERVDNLFVRLNNIEDILKTFAFQTIQEKQQVKQKEYTICKDCEKKTDCIVYNSSTSLKDFNTCPLKEKTTNNKEIIFKRNDEDIAEVCRICKYKNECIITNTCYMPWNKTCAVGQEKCKYTYKKCKYKCPRRLKEV